MRFQAVATFEENSKRDKQITKAKNLMLEALELLVNNAFADKDHAETLTNIIDGKHIGEIEDVDKEQVKNDEDSLKEKHKNKVVINNDHDDE